MKIRFLALFLCLGLFTACSTAAVPPGTLAVTLSHGYTGEALSGRCVAAASGEAYALRAGIHTQVDLTAGETLLFYGEGMIPVVLVNAQPAPGRKVEILLCPTDGNDTPMVLCDHPPMEELKRLAEAFRE